MAKAGFALARSRRPDDDALGEPSSQVIAMPWDDFAPWFTERWGQGEHIAVVGPTGSGKTTLQMRLGELRNWAAVLDGKGGDRTLDAAGWQRVTRWPLPLHLKSDIKEGEPAHLIIGHNVKTFADRPKHRTLLRKALRGLWAQRNWSVLVDEVQLLTDVRFLGLANDVVELLIAARDRGLSVVAALQRVSIGNTTGGASGTLGDQSTWLAFSYSRDDRAVQRLAELAGRPASEVRTVVTSLPEHAWCIVGRDPRAPYVITKPRPIGNTQGQPEQAPQPRLRERAEDQQAKPTRLRDRLKWA